MLVILKNAPFDRGSDRARVEYVDPGIRAGVNARDDQVRGRAIARKWRASRCPPVILRPSSRGLNHLPHQPA